VSVGSRNRTVLQLLSARAASWWLWWNLCSEVSCKNDDRGRQETRRRLCNILQTVKVCCLCV